MNLTFNQNSTLNQTEGNPSYLTTLNQFLFNRQNGLPNFPNFSTRFPRPSRRPSMPTRRPIRPNPVRQPSFINTLFKLLFERSTNSSQNFATILTGALDIVDDHKIELYQAFVQKNEKNTNEDPITAFSRMVRAIIQSKVNLIF
jgi:hypothetical protein